MAWRKLTAEETASFDAALPADPRVVRAKMFGLPHGKVGEYMFAGRHAVGVTVRVAPEERDRLLAKGAKLFEPMPGRQMKDWVVVPEDVAGNPKKLAEIVRHAFEHTATLPPKKKPAAKTSRAKKQ
jgi:hypothetical protein